MFLMKATILHILMVPFFFWQLQ